MDGQYSSLKMIMSINEMRRGIDDSEGFQIFKGKVK